MVVVYPGPGALDCRVLSAFYARDPSVGNHPVIIFHGPSTTTNSTQNSSRIQAHIFSIAGFQSFPRLTISPTSPLYSAVHQLPPEDQGDEICRGLAICLLKYFSEIPKPLKQFLLEQQATSRDKAQTPAVFDGQHAANLASRMVRVENVPSIANHLLSGLAQQCLSWIDMDVILPKNSITRQDSAKDNAELDDGSAYLDDGRPPVDYGKFAEIVDLFGAPSFLPTSKLRRAPSRPTALNRSRTLTEEQILSLQREMKEILETEKSYVLKLEDLMKSTAAEYCRNEIQDPSRQAMANTKAMQQLFPPSLTQILDINKEFLGCMQDLTVECLPRQGKITSPSRATDRDPTGADAFAKLLLSFFPRFRTSYQEYLRLSSHSQSTLNLLMRDNTTNFSGAVQETGEQRLRSWLIEPVQRLPRYSLYIENIVNKLPTAHPALSKLLRAKDMIADICALEQNELGNNSQTMKTLKALIANWPEGLEPQGRLITAVDVVDLKAPYTIKASMQDESQSILLLFPNYVLVVRKSAGSKLSARGLLAEVDRPSLDTNGAIANSQASQQQFLNLSYSLRLCETWSTESADGRLIHLACVSQAPQNSHNIDGKTRYLTSTRVFALLGSYEGKAARWNEKVSKARVEARFPERTREDERWSLRVISPQQENLGVISALFEDGLDAACATREGLTSRIKIILEHAEHPSEAIWENQNQRSDIMGRVTATDTGKYRVEFRNFEETGTLDNVEADSFVSIFTKRLGDLIRIHQQPNTPKMVQTLISANQKIAESIRPILPSDQTQLRSRIKPVSPVKAISSFLGSISREQFSYTKLPGVGTGGVASRTGAPTIGTRTLPRVPTQIPSSRTETNKTGMSETKPSTKPVDTAFTQLETTLSTYVVALHSRCGNIVGRVIRNRANADVLAVNELYNVLLEDPNQYQSTAEVPIDVLFSAFEKFLNREWKTRVGPILPQHILDRMDTLFNTVSSSLLQDPFRDLLNEMSPQNRRAFSALTKLLYELLEASGNDGDRGALTAAFAEIMAQEADPHPYIPVLDRLVENIDVLFDDIGPIDANPASKNSSLQGTRSTNTGSLSSTASSLKKRFGFGTLSRENSKTEPESRVGQILRNLSKKASTEANLQPPSLSRSFLARSRSTDNENRRPPLTRPGSQDSNQVLSGSSRINRPATAIQGSPVLPSNNETIKVGAQDTPRRKRRSSLSDLASLHNSPVPDFASPNRPRKIDIPADSVSPFQSARRVLRTPSPSKMQRTPGEIVSKIPSPTNLKENMPPKTSNRAGQTPFKQPVDTNLGSGFSPKKRELGSSQIPAVKHGALSPPNQMRSSGKPSPQKLRMQSPQKLRERLEREKKAIAEAGPSLQAEMSRIGNELAASKVSLNGPAIQSKDLTSRFSGLETRTSTLLEDLTKRMSLIQADVDSSLAVSEKKAKSLDDLYRESNAENELLYERFNTELGRVLKSVKDGVGTQEIRTKLKESQDEAARLRKENQRLKRENLGLRSQLKGP